MKDFKELIEFREMIEKIPSAGIDEKKIDAVFKKLKKQLGIPTDKELYIYERIYLQPFKLEYVGTKKGLKNYIIGLDQQRKEKAQSYCKLVKKNGDKLEVIKSFDRVDKISDEQFAKLTLLVRLAQYVNKARELYSLEISMLQLFKK
ncbi:MAG: hypothetical protein PHE67_10405 [Campylobacterales bacterium]|nr:hypothetical protein [Campylobacterales bacterium]